jgi:4-hydroxy-4-methyl-2-oxoglutarate aldolase
VIGQDEETIAALRDIPTTNLSDALDKLGIGGAMSGIRILDYSMGRMAGRARTILQGPRHVGAEPQTSYVGHVRFVDEMLKAGDVVVIGVTGAIDASSWGYLLSLRSRKRGAAGTIVDGYVRDPAQLVDLGYPIFLRSIGCPAGTKLRAETLAIDQPIQCGGIQVRPGNFLVGDDSGVVVIPEECAAEVIDVARKIQSWEREIIDRHSP